MAKHPFDPLHATEIAQAAKLVRYHWAGQDINIRVITLQEPRKHVMLDYLERHRSNQPTKEPPRRARVELIITGPSGKNELYEAVVDLDQNKIIENQKVNGKHSYIDTAYMQQVESACLANERVQEELRKLKLPAGSTPVVEPWAYATDGMKDMAERITMCWFYCRHRDHPEANYYAYPLDLCAEVSEKLEVMRVFRLPTRLDGKIDTEETQYDQRKILSDSSNEYHPDLTKPSRNTIRPLHIVQPDGPSFKIDGYQVSWENWTFRIGFNYREGLTLHDIRYDDRSLFYRLSLAEMFVPYGDPRNPYQRKGAFDLGNDGAGINANNLRLGCDCLGTIKYFDAWLPMRSGDPKKLPNVVCVHEQDDGILWKHTNFRTGTPVVTRSRQLVLQTIITVSNYEYVFAFQFCQDASIFYEIRATGILSTVPHNLTQEVNVPFGTIVAPGVLAPYHQHLFCLRIDPAIDGPQNSLCIEESEAMPIDDPDVPNPFGIGYQTKTQYINKESGMDLDINKARVFKFVNENRINPITGTPVGFKLLPQPSQMLLARPDSYHAKRSEFARHAVWVTSYEDDDLFPAGKYTMQSSGGDGIASKIEGRRSNRTAQSVRNADIVVWHTFGSTHNPRIEDWPVMPAEKMLVGLKPVNFFTGNPAIDVAVSTQCVNQSKLYDDKNGIEVNEPHLR